MSIATDFVFDISAAVPGCKEVRNLAAMRRDCLRADLRRIVFGDAVQHAGELVLCVFANLLRTVWFFVVESLHGAEGLGEPEVTRTAGGDDLATREVSELDGKTASCGTAAVDKYGLVQLSNFWQRETQALVETLSDSRDTDAKRAGFLIRNIVRHLALHVAFDHGVFREAAIFFFHGIYAVRESSNTISRLEFLGDSRSHLYDSAHVIAAGGAAFGLCGKGGIADVLPVESVSVCTPLCELFIIISTYQSVGFKATA